MKDLSEAFQEYADRPDPMEPAVLIVARRAFYAGALATTFTKQTRDEIVAECVQFGRSIGTAAESARS